MPIPDGSVIVTPRQMYEEIQETRKAVDRLTTSVDPALSDLRTDAIALALKVAENERSREAHGNRITALETRQKVMASLSAGAVVVFGSVIGVLVSHVWR